ncbi:hypothetical protein [Microbacterium hibisci]|uniref:hypothetical protein n=1 Tax=Microbacterium hibisci TaxID=2036000 RepID=UPI0019441A37|nr:hypothetical protein [Microbacterium hibisci]
MTEVSPRRAMRPMRVARIVHRWAGLLLFFWVSIGTLLTLPYVYEQTGATGVAGVVEVFRLEAEGGGAVNLPVTLVLIATVAGLGVALLVDLVRRGREPFVRAGSPLGWLYLLHRWAGTLFTLSLVAYLFARLAMGAAPPALGWAWVLLLFTVNVLGVWVFIFWAVGAIRRRGRARRRSEVTPARARPTPRDG